QSLGLLVEAVAEFPFVDLQAQSAPAHGVPERARRVDLRQATSNLLKLVAEVVPDGAWYVIDSAIVFDRPMRFVQCIDPRLGTPRGPPPRPADEHRFSHPQEGLTASSVPRGTGSLRVKRQCERSAPRLSGTAPPRFEEGENRSAPRQRGLRAEHRRRQSGRRARERPSL